MSTKPKERPVRASGTKSHSLPRAASDSCRGPLPRTRAIISVAILFHLIAVFAAALRVPPVSQLEITTAWAVQWYTDAVLVNPGYRFFAPDPGFSSDMMRVVVTQPDGQQREERYPDLAHEWPRLRYHRHFMLTSRLANDPAAPITRALAESYARHVAIREGAREARVFRVAHAIPRPDEFLTGTNLTDERLYRTEFSSPAGTWSYAAAGPLDRPRLELRLAFDGSASLEGEILGKAVHSEWKWRPGPRGPLEIGFFSSSAHSTLDARGALPDWTADWPEPNRLILHYPLAGARVGAPGEVIEHVPLRRETPPLATYREKER
jgi:hypothetical protein